MQESESIMKQIRSTIRQPIVPWVIVALLVVSLIYTSIEHDKNIRMLDDDISKLQNELQQTTAAASAAQSELEEKLRAANEQLTQVADRAKQELEEATQPEATFVVRKGKHSNLFSKDEYYTEIVNISGKDTPATITFKRPSTNQERSFNFVFRGGEAKEIDEASGWVLIDGDTIEIVQPGHKTKLLSVN